MVKPALKSLFYALLIIFICVNTSIAQIKTPSPTSDTLPIVHLAVTQLPDMNIARSGHIMFVVNNELTVFGGHQTGFIPTDSAEYLKDGKWHLMKMVYSHDDGFAVKLKSGDILLGGGHEKHLGIGQTFVVEKYYPEKHDFEGFGCLDTKRALANAVQLPNGKVLVAGNWYHQDAIELFDGHKTFEFVKHVSQQRSAPYILPTAQDNAIILSLNDTCGKQHDEIIIDQLNGEPIKANIFEKWKPLINLGDVISTDFFVGDEKKNCYINLLPLLNSHGQPALAKVEGEQISLLTTEHEIPHIYHGDSIIYFNFLVDRQVGKAYIIGVDTVRRWYVVAVDYDTALKTGKPAPLTFYQTEQMPVIAYSSPQFCIMDGNIVASGGVFESNYQPSAKVFMFNINEPMNKSLQVWSVWSVILACFGAILCFTIFCILLRKLQQRTTKSQLRQNPEQISENVEMESKRKEDLTDDRLHENLETIYERLCALMKNEKLYLEHDLKLFQVTMRMGVSQRYISEAIKHKGFNSFNAFVNHYRIEKAKKMLAENPEIKITRVYLEAGFANETSFFRTFKKTTGMTPREWQNTSIQKN